MWFFLVWVDRQDWLTDSCHKVGETFSFVNHDIRFLTPKPPIDRKICWNEWINFDLTLGAWNVWCSTATATILCPRSQPSPGVPNIGQCGDIDILCPFSIIDRHHISKVTRPSFRLSKSIQKSYQALCREKSHQKVLRKLNTNLWGQSIFWAISHFRLNLGIWTYEYRFTFK